MASESIDINLNTRGADSSARGISSVGDAAAKTAVKLDILAASQKVFNDSTLKMGKAANTSEAALRSHVAADKLYTDAIRVASGETTKFTSLIHKMPGDLDKASASADKLGKAAGAAAGTGLAGVGAMQGGGMGALVAAGAVLSPILASLATGAAGFGLAAYGVIKPITAAAQATGGLQKNLHTLNAEQQVVARGILGLGKEYGAFQKALQPVVLRDFSAGLQLAGHVLHDVEPVAAAFGKAFGGFLGQIDKMFASGTWQSFFAFMARTVGPDLKQTGSLFIDLADTLPPLVMALQPVASLLVKTADGLAKTAGAAEALGPNALLAASNVGKFSLSAKQASTGTNVFNEALDILVGPQRTSSVDNFFHSLRDGLHILTTNEGMAQKKTTDMAVSLGQWKTVSEQVVTQTGRLGKETDITNSKVKVFAGTTASVIDGLKKEAKHLNILAGGYTNALTPLENYINAQITQRGDLSGLNAALKLSHDRIGLNTQAQRNSYSAAETYISNTIATGNAALAAHKGIQGQIDVIEKAIPKLESVKGKTADYKRELDLLKGILDKLRAEKRIDESVRVTGTGSWSYQQSGTGHAVGPGGYTGAAAGALVSGGVAGRDSVPIMAMPGELVVPTKMVSAGAVDHLRGSIPGFAAGGVVPSYSGPVAGLPPWTSHNQQATVTAITAGIAKAMTSAFSSLTGFGIGGPGGGSPSANAALARRMMPGWGSGMEWAAWNYLAMRESGWNQFARNPSSGAYGIAQALPPTKYPFAGQAAGGSNPRAQIGWMVGYIASRYGDPVAAAQHEASVGWYDHGGLLKPGLTLAYNGTGRSEMVIPAGRGGVGTTVVNHVTVQVGHGTHPVAAAQEIVKILNVGARNGVRLRTSILGPG